MTDQDLVARLREFHTANEVAFHIDHAICDEAADAIERLTAEVEALRADVSALLEVRNDKLPVKVNGRWLPVAE